MLPLFHSNPILESSGLIGQAWEVYRNQQLTKALSFGVSYVYIDYDYSGSNAFFGKDGDPDTQLDVVSAQDVRAYMRYRF